MVPPKSLFQSAFGFILYKSLVKKHTKWFAIESSDYEILRDKNDFPNIFHISEQTLNDVRVIVLNDELNCCDWIGIVKYDWSAVLKLWDLFWFWGLVLELKLLS
jgi:hypothetical protein